MAKKKKTKIVCKEYKADVCEQKDSRIVCKKKKMKVCVER